MNEGTNFMRGLIIALTLSVLFVWLPLLWVVLA